MGKQEQLGLMGGVLRSKIVDMPSDWVAKQTSFPRAIRAAIDHSGLTVEQVALRIGYANHSALSQMTKERKGKGSKELPSSKWLLFCQVVGNWGIYQWKDMERKGQLLHQRPDVAARKAELLAELKALEAA